MLINQSPSVAGVSILDARGDPNLFAPWFRDAETWSAWRAFLAALFALPMDAGHGRDLSPLHRPL